MNVLIYSNEIATSEYTPSHPFKAVRAKFFYELLHRYGLIGNVDQKIVAPQALDERLLSIFHDKEYLQLLKKADSGVFSPDMLWAGLGTGDNPIFKGLYHQALVAAGGTYHGAEMLMKGEAEVVFTPIGGFHHAGRGHAEGFCYINDIAVTIEDLIRKGVRVAYIDIDAHHGNGVQDAFYETDRVLFISLHESGESLYPGSGFELEIGVGKGRGYTVNIPLREDTDDEIYLYAFQSTVPQLINAYKPQVVFAVLGCDTHKNDPLSHLCLTSNGYEQVVRMIRAISPRILAMGAGGYDIHKTAAMWTLAWASLCGLKPEDRYTGLIGGAMYGSEMHAGSLNDEPYITEGRKKELCMARARKAVEFIRQRVFPLLSV